MKRFYIAKMPEKHGMSNTPEYSAWCNIKKRCYDPSSKYYEHYGGRGIKVCDRWRYSFSNFYEDLGLRPSKDYSLDRINNNGNYEPSNCRWATKYTQVNNKRTNRKITIGNVTQSLKVWTDDLNIPYYNVKNRLNHYDWSLEESLELSSAKRIYRSKS
jgi:hypothetical protein